MPHRAWLPLRWEEKAEGEESLRAHLHEKAHRDESKIAALELSLEEQTRLLDAETMLRQQAEASAEREESREALLIPELRKDKSQNSANRQKGPAERGHVKKTRTFAKTCFFLTILRSIERG